MTDVDFFMGLKRNSSQNRFIFDTKRFIVWSANRRCGKTYALCWGAGLDAFEFPNNVVLIARQVKEHLWTTTYKTWRRLFPKDLFGLDYEGGEREPKAVWFPNGSVVYFMGFDSDDKYLGLELGSFWIDQVEQIHRDSWLVCEANIGSLPHIPVHRTRGRGIGNPRGHYWAYQRFVQKLDVTPSHADQYLWLKSPKYENTHNLPEGRDLYDRLEASYPPHLRAAMIDGSDDSFSGMAFPEFLYDANVVELNPSLVSSWVPWVGMDHGYNPNPTVILLGWWSPDHGVLYIAAEHVMANTLPEDHVKLVRQLARDVDFPMSHSNFVGDYQIKGLMGSKGVTIWQEYHMAGFTWLACNKEMEGSLERTNRLLKHRRLLVNPKRCRTLIQQLQTVIVDNSTKLLKLEPEHDAIDALRYLVMKLPLDSLSQIVEPAKHGTYEDWSKAAELGGNYAPTIGDPWAKTRPIIPLLPGLQAEDAGGVSRSASPPPWPPDAPSAEVRP